MQREDIAEPTSDAAHPTTGNDLYDLIIIGANAAGLSIALAFQQAGLARVRIVEAAADITFADVAENLHLDIGTAEPTIAVDAHPSSDGPRAVMVTTTRGTYYAHGCVIAAQSPPDGVSPAGFIMDGQRVRSDESPPVGIGNDVLVVGNSDWAIELSARIAAGGAGVVLAAGGLDPATLSSIAQAELQRLELERRATILYRAVPQQIGVVDGFPMVSFRDRRTPDLQFDYVVFALSRVPVERDTIGMTAAAAGSSSVWFATGTDIETIAATFPGISIAPTPNLADRRRNLQGSLDDLRAEHYNATITHFEPTHSDLWTLRVRPDNGDVAHLPGQYASLGLGHWEPRIDTAQDPDLDGKWDKLIRRSYSISSRMFDEHGYLTGDLDADELEFYIVLVPPTDDNVPALTPRLALKKPGDRIYLGPKIAGRYTLKPIVDPDATLLFFSTGTGEAPHNAMIVELLRKRHRGPIVSAVSIRKWSDLGYAEQHRALERDHPNYHYLPMPTREVDVPKRYLQDLILHNTLADDFGITLDPASTHLFLCGNPAMIGLPTIVDGMSTFPETTGVVELMVERGFTLDHGTVRGNIHFEEYW